MRGGRVMSSESISSLQSNGANVVIMNPNVEDSKPKSRRVSVYYGDYSSVDLTWTNVSVEVTPKKGVLCFSKALDKKVILNDVSGYAKSGQMLAIMGSSGGGKSTLLDALSGRTNTEATLRGEICANGQALGTDISHISSYVQQEDLFIGTLTVRETLSFQANLRLGHLDDGEKIARVNEMINEGELTKVANSLVGVPGGDNQCLSGGERKRLSFCLEVLLGKPLIFADEPTSGLDASMAEKIVLFLKRLASSQRNIVVTIHQPSSDVYALFDNVMLLTGGQVAYFGPREKANDFFASLGHACPVNYSPADFFVKTLAYSKTTSDTISNAIVNSYATGEDKKECDSIINELKIKHQSKLSINKSGRVPFMKEFWILLLRNVRILTRNPILNHIRVFQHIAVAIFFGLSFLQTDSDRPDDIAGCLFLIVYMLSLFGVFNNIQVLPTELPLFVREYRSGMYSILAWYIAKALIEIPACIFLPLVFNCICYPMIFKDPDFEKFMFLWFICALAILTSTSIAYFVSVIGWEPLNTMAIAPTVYAPHFLFCGQFIKITSVPDYMEPFQATSWLRYSYEAAIITYFGDWGGQTNETSKLVISSLEMEEDALWVKDVPALLGLTIGFHVLGFLLLLLRSRKK